jgi:hypothetical protein
MLLLVLTDVDSLAEVQPGGTPSGANGEQPHARR